MKKEGDFEKDPFSILEEGGGETPPDAEELREEALRRLHEKRRTVNPERPRADLNG